MPRRKCLNVGSRKCYFRQFSRDILINKSKRKIPLVFCLFDPCVKFYNTKKELTRKEKTQRSSLVHLKLCPTQNRILEGLSTQRIFLAWPISSGKCAHGSIWPQTSYKTIVLLSFNSYFGCLRLTFVSWQCLPTLCEAPLLLLRKFYDDVINNNIYVKSPNKSGSSATVLRTQWRLNAKYNLKTQHYKCLLTI